MPCKHIIEALKPGANATCFEPSNVAKENGKKFEIKTEKKVCKIKNDDCLDKTQDSKCDYVFHASDGQHVLMVELKGDNVTHAYEQIIGTYKKLKPALNPKVYQYQGFIVSNGLPRTAEQTFRKLKEQAKRDFNLKIEKQTNLYIHRL